MPRWSARWPRSGWARYGAVFFEPIPEAALVLGLDLGARFLRGALCDLRGDIRARQDVEVDGADVSEVLRAIEALQGQPRRGEPARRKPVDGVVVGVPGAVDEAGRASTLRRASLASRACSWASSCRSGSAHR